MIIEKIKTRMYYQVLSLLWSYILVVNISACSDQKLGTQDASQVHAALRLAVLVGNIDTIRGILEQQPSEKEKASMINSKDKEGNTMLHIACKYRQGEVVQFLVDNGADMSIKNLENRTAKGLADEKIETLLQAKEREIQGKAEDQEWKNKGLCKACEKGDLKKVEEWIKSGANVNGIDQWGRTALGIACGKEEVDQDKLEMVKYLVSKGADVNQQTDGTPFSSSTYPLLLACKWKPKKGQEEIHLELVKILVDKKANLNAQNNYGCTPLYEACRLQEAPELVEYLLKEGADMKIETWGADRGRTPLYVACENGYPEVVQKLINYGANVNEKKAWCINQYKSPLRIACEMGQVEVVKLLLKSGANADERIVFCSTVSKQVQEQIKSLLEKACKEQSQTTKEN